MPRLILLSGPSGIGKSPLLRTLQRHYPELATRLKPLVLYNDREPRPGEVDGLAYHFRPRPVIEALRQQPGHVVLPVRRDLQALEIAQVTGLLDQGWDPFFEGNPYVAQALMTAPELAGVPRVSCFLSPVTREELEALAASDLDPRAVVTDLMRQKLRRRTHRQKGLLQPSDREDIEARCGAAFDELAYAPDCDWVLPNHDGEDSENWEAFGLPVGDARRCLLDFAAILQGQPTRWAEQWPRGLTGGE